MTRASLTDVLQPALRDGYAVAGLVCLGWEDTRAYVAAAEAEGAPVILQAGPGARAHTPLPVLAAMFRSLADAAQIPVVLHLDHGASVAECREAIDEGFTSVMFDGSRLPLSENIDQTAAIATMAHSAGVSCEGEIGFVGYDDGAASKGTDPQDAALFAMETGVDAMAVSVGNVHLQQHKAAKIDQTRLCAIQALTNTPLVIHGGSGLSSSVRRQLAGSSNVCKVNIGTELRMEFGRALREALDADRKCFDRIGILHQTEKPLTTLARNIIRELRGETDQAL